MCNNCPNKAEWHRATSKPDTEARPLPAPANRTNVEPILVILPDTPVSLVDCMDDYTRRLMKLRWWNFAERRFLKNWIIKCHIKRINLLTNTEEKTHEE